MASPLDVISMAFLLLVWLGLLALVCILDGGGDDDNDWYYHHHW